VTHDEGLTLVMRALDYAARQHTAQRRKDAAQTPYINHPIEVIKVLAVEAGITDPEVLAAAALHDTVEDTSTEEGDLRRLFGDRITDIVMEVTDDGSLRYEVRKRLQVEHAPKKTAAAAMVKFADKISNLRDVVSSPPPSWTLDRRREYFDWAKAVVDRLPPVSAKLRKLFDDAYAAKP
jgi:guanosine-3',5'-bis(diphosphate) 3'-pyrophosphohydrolase